MLTEKEVFVIIDVREYIEHLLEINPNISGDMELEEVVIDSIQRVMDISLDLYRYRGDGFINDKLVWLHIVYPSLFETLSGFTLDKNTYNPDIVSYYFHYLNEIFQDLFVRRRCDKHHTIESIIGYSVRARVG
jgi:hypothetical protein